MPSNQSLADRLARMGQLLELLGEDSFKASAHARAARAIESLPQELEPVASQPDPKAAKTALTAIDGIGEKIAAKIIEYFTTGVIREHDELAAKVPAGLLELLNIPGLGPKTVRAMWQTLGITGLAALKAAIDTGTILSLPRMGEKAVQRMKESIALLEQGNERLWLGQAHPLARRLIAALTATGKADLIAAAGSLRRGKETVGDLDILVATTDPAAISIAFRTLPEVTQVIASGDSKSSVRVSVDPDWGRWKSDAEAASASASSPQPTRTIQCDLRVIPRASWGAALMYFTGSKEHNVALRQRALDLGLTLNEYGLFPHLAADAGKPPPQERGVAPVAAATEEEIYARLNLPWIPPELREARGELDLESTPRLVELADIKAELHAHTTASDGSLSIDELASRALARGFHTIAVTDHSQSSTIANGLKPDRLRAHIEAIRKAQERFTDRSGRPTIRVLAGSEVDILADGSLDYRDDLLAQLDLVVASAHNALTQEPAAATERLLRAIAHPRVHILGHPTGRLLNRRAGLAPDMPRLFTAAKEHRVALEINSHWLRLDLRDTHAYAAAHFAHGAGCLIAIDCDVHAPEDFDNLAFGVVTARRGGITPESCISTWPADRLHAWIQSKHAR